MDFFDTLALITIFNSSDSIYVSEEEANRMIEKAQRKKERKWWDDPDLYNNEEE